MSQHSEQRSSGAADEESAGERDVPRARLKRHWGFSWIWLIPIGALALLVYLFYPLTVGRGPSITIAFETAEGLSPQQTQVKYKAVTVGTVEDVTLSDDLSHVVAEVRMDSHAEALLTEDTRFWVVRPRLSGGLSAISTGLKTLVSGPYVAMDPGAAGGEPKRHFRGLEKPPRIGSDEPGTVYSLKADELGSVGVGTPIYYRDVTVGEVLSYELLTEPQQVRLRIFVRAPYDERVVAKTVFWNASGASLQTDAGGLRLEVQSIRALLMGGIAFRTPEEARGGEPSRPESAFRLHDSRSAAEAAVYRDGIPYVSYFQTSVSGLTAGSEVHMFGRKLGAVTEVALARDPRSSHEGELTVRVAYSLRADRALPEEDPGALHQERMRALVDDGLRVVLKTQNLLTGQKALSLEYVPRPGPVELLREDEALVLPSEAQGWQAMSESLTAVASQLGKIPFAAIGQELHQTLVSVERTVSDPQIERAIASLDATLREAHALFQEVRAGARPALARLPRIAKKLEEAADQVDVALGQNGYGADSTVQRNLERVMDQVAQASRSIRLLADYLQRHPEALIRGRKREEP